MKFIILVAGTQELYNVKIIPKQTTGIYIGSIGSGWQKDTCLQIHKDAMLHSLRTSSHFQALPSESQELLLQSVVGRIDQHLKSAAEENMIVHSLASVACGRIAQHFDLKGPHVSIDAGYSSSLAALEVGIRSLQEGSVDLSLVGGASEILTPLNMIAFAKLGGLSRSLVRPFDAQADGTLLGEGTAMFALKRLEDAIRDKEHIYAVIKGVGSSSDGQGKSLLAPDTRGQIIAMKRAYEDAGIEPQSIRYV
ncbi:MAG: polyketide synthase, partial [Clostridia bacterium]